MRNWSGVLVAAVAALAGCAPGDADARVAMMGEVVPRYAAAGLDGTPVSLESLRGRVVLLNVWATWCPPCRAEMPDLQVLHREWEAAGLTVLAVSVDAADAGGAIREFLGDAGVTFPVLHDPREEVTRRFRTMGVPQTFLIDREGVLRQQWIGKVSADSPALREAIRQALGTP